MKTLERGWALAPHPDLAALYLEASGESDPLKRVGVMRRLAAHKRDDIGKPSGARPGDARRRRCGARRGGISRPPAAAIRRCASAA